MATHELGRNEKMFAAFSGPDGPTRAELARQYRLSPSRVNQILEYQARKAKRKALPKDDLLYSDHPLGPTAQSAVCWLQVRTDGELLTFVEGREGRDLVAFLMRFPNFGKVNAQVTAAFIGGLRRTIKED